MNNSRTQARQHDRALMLAIKTLALYADPRSYHAIMIVCDRPSGWFADDRSKTVHYDRKMHGKEARRTLEKIRRIVAQASQRPRTGPLSPLQP